MTVRTTRGDAGVVHCPAGKSCRRLMTCLAASGCLNVITRFTFCRCTVMTGRTTRGDARVIHYTTTEAIGVLVTSFT